MDQPSIVERPLPTLDDLDYNAYIECMREVEYPMLKDAVYLDHAGTTLYSKRLMERFTSDMMSNLFGNPHSASHSSQTSTLRIDEVRLQLLRFLNADPNEYDLVFVANATAAIKLVGDAFRDHEQGFWYGYHRDAHTSLVGVRELALHHQCFESDAEVEDWLVEEPLDGPELLQLFAYPAQSNMNGRRLPLAWCKPRENRGNSFILLDAAGLLSTSPLDLGNISCSPDFVALSLYKIFGFPDLGALVVKKSSGWVFQHRKFFGGGTVDMVVSLKEQWHAKKTSSVHDQLEDGTLPIHSIVALGSAITVHQELYGSLEKISRHTSFLAKRLHSSMRELRHGNGRPIAQIYNDELSDYSDSSIQGPVIAFNLIESGGAWVSNTEMDKLAAIRHITLRTGGLCNPGGIASSLGLVPWEMKSNFSAGQRCGTENDVMNGKPIGMIRVSIGAMSTMSDADSFIAFLKEFFVHDSSPITMFTPPLVVEDSSTSRFHVESLTVYPIKSCAGWRIPFDTSWVVRPEGLAWDREWCLIHQGTGAVLSQKRYPKMALIRPHLDFHTGSLRVGAIGWSEEISVPLSADPRCFADYPKSRLHQTDVCGDIVTSKVYKSPAIANFFTQVVGVPCALARFPAATLSTPSTRHSKAHLTRRGQPELQRPILFSNESPILTISRSSLNRLNEMIKAKHGKAASSSVFRANIVLAESPVYPPGSEQPYAEDYWRYMQIQGQTFEFLGGCRRCQMVCVDQATGEKNQEPFVTLAKTRRYAGKVLFGVHTCHVASTSASGQSPTIKAGDAVTTFKDGESL